ncbi:glycosyltransferase family 25 protein [Lichenifustis flavocetrariae]|uniref:Glycosyltransferase family 25 protein n=1 Tax=Lichenifustis flavocetrariae TaxID=2949735 RepID=A0AA41Z2D5_9HYPH|nr:glycosyltransferase family 25 protein [Lichenifustis flavocetrariae]MCW6511593.1 glycosyltransferase family 25 protein [Lichenifustis flavocetrariae]
MGQESSKLLRTSIYVINLERSIERRTMFEAHAAASQTSLSWVYHRAHTELSDDLHYDPRDALIAKGRELYPAELGVYSSHHSVWKRFLAEGADQALILEDDVVLDWDFVIELTRIDLGQMGLRYLKLFNKNITPYRLVSEHFCRRTLIDCRGFAHGMQAYMVTRSGVAHFAEFCRQVRRPIDDELDRTWAHGIPNIAVFPFPAFERHGPTTIGTVRYEPHSLPRKLNLPRFTMRLAEKLRRGRQRVAGYGFQPPLTN